MIHAYIQKTFGKYIKHTRESDVKFQVFGNYFYKSVSRYQRLALFVDLVPQILVDESLLLIFGDVDKVAFFLEELEVVDRFSFQVHVHVSVQNYLSQLLVALDLPEFPVNVYEWELFDVA